MSRLWRCMRTPGSSPGTAAQQSRLDKASKRSQSRYGVVALEPKPIFAPRATLAGRDRVTLGYDCHAVARARIAVTHQRG